MKGETENASKIMKRVYALEEAKFGIDLIRDTIEIAEEMLQKIMTKRKITKCWKNAAMVVIHEKRSLPTYEVSVYQPSVDSLQIFLKSNQIKSCTGLIHTSPRNKLDF